jgi:hypothetical protein
MSIVSSKAKVSDCMSYASSVSFQYVLFSVRSSVYVVVVFPPSYPSFSNVFLVISPINLPSFCFMQNVAFVFDSV